MKKISTAIFLFFVIAGGSIAFVFWKQNKKQLSFETVKQSFQPSDIDLLDRNGEFLNSLRINPNVRRLSWVENKNLPDYFIQLILQAEDHRFMQHHGVDWLGLGSATFHLPFYKRGASTISMQLVAMLDSDLKNPKRKTIVQKLLQIIGALLIERQWTKQEILEAYFNLSFYRGELQGIHAATMGIFQKEITGLTIEEAAILAASIQQPNGTKKRISDRACKIATSAKLVSNCDSIHQQMENQNTKSYSIDKKESWAPHVARLLLKNKTQNVQSTLDKNLQIFVKNSINKQLDELKEKNVSDAAVLVLNNNNGEVLAYVGNSENEKSYYIDGIQTLRQAGSTLKPFLYTLAFEDRILTPTSILNDSPLEISIGSGVYRPQNYDEKFHGKITVRTALGSSMNVPAVKTIMLIGVEHFVERLKNIGFSKLMDATFYGPSIALGSADVTLWQLTNAYRTLANRGIYSDPKLISDDQTVEKEVFSENSVFLVSDILSDNNNRSLTFGLSNPLSGHSWFAVKTGTSKDMRDNWCIGYSNLYTVGVWVGNFTGEPMQNVSGVTGAAPIFSEVMNWLHKDQPSTPPLPPDGVVKGSKNDWFLAGTESSHELKISTFMIPRITYPTNDTIFAWDPDIPVDSQKILFEAKNYNTKWFWKLNDKNLGKANAPLYWAPEKNGKFELTLIDDQKHVLDSVQFQVRGMPTK